MGKKKQSPGVGGGGGVRSSSPPIASSSSTPPAPPADDPTTHGMASGSVSASFPYIPMPAEDGGASSALSSASGGKKKSSAKASGGWHPTAPAAAPSIAADSRLEPPAGRGISSASDKAKALSLLHAIILRQSASRGVVTTDPSDPRSPWRTDDSLISPEIWTAYEQYPQFVQTFLQYADPSVVGAETVEELTRYIALIRFGEIEQNAWKIMKRLCALKRNSRAVVWLGSSGAIEKDWTFSELYSRICAFSLYIKNDLKLVRGDRAILAFVPGLEFFVAFWACLSQGVVAVPVTPIDPFNPRSDVGEKLAAIVSSCSPAAFITTSEYVSAIEAGRAYLDSMKEAAKGAAKLAAQESMPFDLSGTSWVCLDTCLEYAGSFDPSAPFADNVGNGFSLAFLQFTSGSTGAPKGVMVGHSHIVSNVSGCTEETRASRDFAEYRRTIAVSWLPTFHDMGLMGFHLSPILSGTPVVYFSPLDFLAQPTLWLQVLTEWSHHDEYSHVTTGGPPFALDLVVKKMATASEVVRDSVDLSGVISIILGAEPIRAVSMLGFAEAMEPFGFKAECFMPAYGLAENVLHVCGKKNNTYPPTLLHVESQALSEGRVVEFDPSPDARVRGPGKWLVSCGEIQSIDPNYWPGMRTASGSVVSVNPNTLEECQDGLVGELWITGKCVTSGYWNNAAATSHAYSARLSKAATSIGQEHIKASFYRTGDLGCWFQGQLYITGRLKEMIIVNGTKHYANDIEEAIRVATLDGITAKVPGAAAASGLRQRHSGGSSSSAPPAASVTAASVKIHLRPGGILASEMENGATGKGELVVFVELAEVAVPLSSSDSKNASSESSASSSSDGKMSSSQVALANSVFKACQRLPAFVRTPTIRCLARWGARYARYQKDSAAAAAASQTEDGAPRDAYSSEQMDAVERALRRAVMGRFGIPVSEVILLRPRSILKTSSGKIRRGATCALLVDGGLDERVLRRSSEKLGLGASKGAAASWTCKPTLSSAADSTSERKAPSAAAAKKPVPSSRAKPSPPAASAAPIESRSSDSEFELVSTSPQSISPASPPAPAVLDFGEVKQRVSVILGEELSLDAETILLLSQTFSFDPENEGATLDEYGLDSLTAMKIAGRLTREFNLLIPMSPYMMFAAPTLDGVVDLIIRLKQERAGFTSAKDFNSTKSTAAAAAAASGKSAAAAEAPSTKPTKTEAKSAQPAAATKASSPPPSSAAASTSSASSSSSSPSAFPFIFGLGCCVPGPGAPQSAIMDVMVTDMELPPKKAAMFAKIGESAGIDRRYSVLPSIEAIYFGRKGLGNNENVEVRNAIFKVEAPALSLDSARAAISDWGGDKLDITHVVAVTCTGVIVPGLEFQVLSGLGLSADTQRLGVTFMGCFGALSGMKAARAFAMESPSHRILLVCTELCSLHMQLDDRIDNLVGSALFADGSGAMIIGGGVRPGERPLFEMHRNASVIIPDTIDMMDWELTCSGMSIGLGKQIPDQIYKYIDSFSAGMLSGTEAHEANFDQCLWALHPGGPMILSAISDRLGLDSLHTSSAWTVLRKYGNMSSATLIFVLRELLQQFAEGETLDSALPVGCTPFIPALAFGPGLNVEGCLLKYVGGPVGTGSSNSAAPDE